MSIKSFIKDLELFKTTKDIQIDIEAMQLKNRAVSISFYVISIASAVALFLGVMQYAKQDEFRSKLIKNAQVPPLTTFFYNDYADEYNASLNKTKELKDEILQLRQSISTVGLSSTNYNFTDYLRDIKEGKVSKQALEIAINNSKATTDWKVLYVKQWIGLNRDLKIDVAGTTQPLHVFVEYLPNFAQNEKAEAIKLLCKALKSHLEDLNEEQIEKALFDSTVTPPSNFQNRIGAPNAQQRQEALLKTELTKDPKELFSNAIFERKNYELLVGNEKFLFNLNDIVIELQKDFEAKQQELLEQAKTKRDIAMSKKSEIEKEIVAKETLYTINQEIIREIMTLKNVPSNYAHEEAKLKDLLTRAKGK